MEVAFTVLMIGMQGAGKTTLLRSTSNRQQQIFPTAGFQICYITSGISPVLIYDCSGEGYNRKNWKSLLPNCNVVCFVIDSADEDRFSIAKETLYQFIDQNKQMKKKSLCIMLNKSDIKNRYPKEIFYKALETDRLGKMVGKLYLKETSSFTKDGLEECFDWMGKNCDVEQKSEE